jgi:hypothetical protein
MILLCLSVLDYLASATGARQRAGEVLAQL